MCLIVIEYGLQHISLIESEFFIASEDKEMAAVAALANLGSNYTWVNSDWKEAETLEEILQCWRYEAVVDEQGNIVKLHFCGENSGDEFFLWQQLAPWVKEVFSACSRRGRRALALGV